MFGGFHKYPAHNSLLAFYQAWQIDPKNSGYNVNFSYELTNEQEVSYLVKNLQELIQLRPYLRQTFAMEDNQLIATIHESLPAEIRNFTSSIADFEKLEHTLIEEPYDLNNQSSVKLSIIRFNDGANPVIILGIHHIIMDGVSIDLFIQELNLLLEGKALVNEDTMEYISKVIQEPFLTTDINPTLTNYIQKINSVADEINYPVGDKNIIRFYTDLLPDVAMEKLTLLSSEHHISIFNLLLIALQIFLAKLFNQSKALIRYPINIRRNKSILGCFGNTIVLYMDLTSENTYLSLIHSWHDQINIFKQMARTMLSDKLDIGLIPNFANDSVTHDALIIQNKRYPPKNFAQIAHSNLNIRYRKQDNKYYFTCDIYANIFPEFFSASLLQRFFNYLNKLLLNPHALLSNTDITFPKEKQTILYDFNKTETYCLTDKTLAKLFEEQVRKTPNNIAVVHEGIKLSYEELNQQANQLAHYLRDQYQIQPDDLIALLINRNETMLVCILAVLKSGGAYIPIDPNYPKERMHFILEDTKAKACLLNEQHISKLKNLSHKSIHNQKVNVKKTPLIAVDAPEIKAKLDKLLCSNPITKTISSNLAYVIYTSGTTGNPKGVMIEHNSVLNTLASIEQTYKSKNFLKMTAFTSYVFDVSVAEFFSALLKGHELHLLSNTIRRDTTLIGEYINMHNINYIYLPPILLASLPKISYKSLQGIVYAGESCDKETGLYWSKKCKLYNYYGPTETAIYATGLQLKAGEVNLIGRPLANVKAYVLDIDENPLPIGLVGELYLGGNCLARGYLNQLKLTKYKFIPNPFQTEAEKIIGENTRLYKTGDFVRWLPDGNLEYLGRNDFQVKIRGHRVELSEIETELTAYPGIHRVVVMIKEHLNNNVGKIDISHLIAYYTADNKLDSSKLYAYLEKKLPEYMLPSTFVYLKNWPLNISGKLDRSALPNPEFTISSNYLPPTNKLEQLVCSAFSNVLGLEKIGINDDFFKLGGTSIKAITLVVQLQNDFKINVADVYNFRTPKKIAYFLPLEKNSLKQHLHRIKLEYKDRKFDYIPDQMLRDKLEKYHASIEQLPIYYEKKSLNHILLTGATGFLGCNLLEQLLTSTNYTIYLLIRASSIEEAYERINNKFQFYFNKGLDDFHKNRLFVFTADIEDKDLGLSKKDYQILAAKIDSVIHSAALTKHYGEYSKFYQINVQGTINLLEFCKLTPARDFHYISTISVLDYGYAINSEQCFFTEDDIANSLEEKSNSYIKSKHYGEEEVLKYEKQGINSTIYRVGNLAFMNSNYRVQENIEDNGFLNRLKCLLSFGIIAKEMNIEEISPVDLTAQAIIKLFDKKVLNHKIYHVFNPNSFNIAEGFSKRSILSLKVVSMDCFIDTLISFLDNPLHQKNIERYLLHQGWLNEGCYDRSIPLLLQDRTHTILQKLGFTWLPVDQNILHEYLKLELEYGETS